MGGRQGSCDWLDGSRRCCHHCCQYRRTVLPLRHELEPAGHSAIVPPVPDADHSSRTRRLRPASARFADCFDALVPPVSNCRVQSTRPADVISADPRAVSSRVAWLTVVVLLAAALMGAILVAVHYRDEAAAVRRQFRSARVPVPPSAVSPVLSSSTAALPSAGPLAGQVTAFVAGSSSGLAQVMVTGRITGGRPPSPDQVVGGGRPRGGPPPPSAPGLPPPRRAGGLSRHP